MMSDTFYFKLNTKEQLYLEYVIFEDIQPVFFICSDDKRNLYICVLCDDRDGLRWIISPTSHTLLSEMMFNKITIRELFESSNRFGDSWLVCQKSGQCTVDQVPFSRIDAEDLPTEGETFDADFDEIRTYYEYFNGASKTRNGEVYYAKKKVEDKKIEQSNRLLLDLHQKILQNKAMSKTRRYLG